MLRFGCHFWYTYMFLIYLLLNNYLKDIYEFGKYQNAKDQISWCKKVDWMIFHIFSVIQNLRCARNCVHTVVQNFWCGNTLVTVSVPFHTFICLWQWTHGRRSHGGSGGNCPLCPLTGGARGDTCPPCPRLGGARGANCAPLTCCDFILR